MAMLNLTWAPIHICVNRLAVPENTLESTWRTWHSSRHTWGTRLSVTQPAPGETHTGQSTASRRRVRRVFCKVIPVKLPNRMRRHCCPPVYHGEDTFAATCRTRRLVAFRC